YESVQDELAQVEQIIRDAAVMNHKHLDRAVEQIIRAGGKRMRPILALLTGQLLKAPQAPLRSVAASIELLHTATLVHDDLIDGAPERRGAPTLHSQLPLGITVLTGDFLFSKAAALAAQAESVRVVQIFSDTLVSICQGEILQAQMRYKVPTQVQYEERIYGKTASLFEAASLAAGVVATTPEETLQTVARFGRQLGMAFQIVDDALDFVATSHQLGKPAGSDMRNGVITLPAIYFVREGHITETALLEHLSNEDEQAINHLLVAMRDSGVVEQALQTARDYVHDATQMLNKLPASHPRDMLSSLAAYTLSRTY
ncbi:MAG: polyprenyl synthetase family protein, partial [Anaerolineales bacterium]